MKKPLMDKLLKEVGDIGDRMYTGLPYATGGGVINVGVATPSSPDDSQNPDEFDQNASIDAGPDGYKNIESDTFKKFSATPNTTPDSPEMSYSPSIAGSETNINTKPQDAEPTQKPNVAIQPEDEVNVEKGIKDIKYNVTPDEVITGINAELKSAVFKRPDVAKASVIKNLKKDPKYYSKLKFLGMNTDLDESLNNKTPQEIAIIKIMRELAEKRKRNKWW
jgi:hypothetical protein